MGDCLDNNYISLTAFSHKRKMDITTILMAKDEIETKTITADKSRKKKF
jgi:hypothetical protein